MNRVFIIIMIFLASCTPTPDICRETKCSNYSTQAEAQAAFDQDPECHANLDRDDDLIPCEHLPDSVID